ncbi:sialate O-acetylesterase [Prosthecobacter sp.]|uniref:sialate O-acetylesterase n=1 Tax=Prosthecobacter sp. TaxID=1965333 RepID=UPI002AB932DA|nr:sialate O-acetylesterase [Prosthecobacter sp.]MDZ4401475.1 sialate O-acetylesterase [Prosthecobacter sp.]
MKLTTLTTLLAALTLTARAELKLPAIIGDNMVLQQKQTNPLWGWDTPGTEVTVKFGDQSKSAKAGADGKWTVKLDPVPANAKPATISIKGSSAKELKNVLVGEVWICSGQSNMQWSVQSSWDADLEIATAKYPNIRLITVPNLGTQEPQQDFKGAWAECSPQNVGGFSAVGFFYGRVLHNMLDVPVGLINNAWGGSAAEAWVNRGELEKDPRFKLLSENTKKNEAFLSSDAAKKQYETNLANWKKQAEEAKAAGKPFTTRAPGAPDAWLRGNARPGNIYNGALLPTIGYGIKGAIWYQGESNAGRAYEYASLFPFMIQNWRNEWKQGDFSFYWVQLADFMAEKTDAEQATASQWAELRESQTKTQSAIQNGGQAVIIDLGESNDIHPKNKRDVAERLARWALVKDYGMKLPYRSPEFKSAEFTGGKAVITLDTFGGSLRTVDVSDVKGFVICGEDKKWAWATAKITGKDKVEVSAAGVSKPVAVRYAWSDNPVCNLLTTDGLPVTPFRSDDFEMLTKPKP